MPELPREADPQLPPRRVPGSGAHTRMAVLARTTASTLRAGGHLCGTHGCLTRMGASHDREPASRLACTCRVPWCISQELQPCPILNAGCGEAPVTPMIRRALPPRAAPTSTVHRELPLEAEPA